MKMEEIANLKLDYIVCNCYEVTLGDIIEAIENGHDTIEAIVHETNASYGCELCQSSIIDKEGIREVHLDEILEYVKQKEAIIQ